MTSFDNTASPWTRHIAGLYCCNVLTWMKFADRAPGAPNIDAASLHKLDAQGACGDAPVRPKPSNQRDVDQLFRNNNAALLRFLAARLGSIEDTKEVAQEAYVHLLGLQHRETISYLRAFLFKTAANLATDRLRQRARRGPPVSAEGLEDAIFELSPDRVLQGEQAMQRLRTALAELPPKCREAFLLYRVQELNCREVAARLGLQERMVWLYIARALEHLQRRVDDSK